MSFIFGALPSMYFEVSFSTTTCYQLEKKEMIFEKKGGGRKEYIIERERGYCFRKITFGEGKKN